MPLMIFLASIFNFLLSSYLVSYLYVFFVFIGIGLIFKRGVVFSKYDSLFLLFGIIFFFFVIMHIIVDPLSFGILSKGIGMYMLFPFYWLFLFRCKSEFILRPFLKSTVNWVVLLAVLGIIQFHFSPNLWGILNVSNSNNIKWATESDGIEYLLFFRSTSLLESPQVYGLFTVLYIYIIQATLVDKPKLKGLYVFLCFIGSAHSGNKMCYVIFLIYLIMILKEHMSSLNIKRILIISIFILSSVIGLVHLSEKYELGMLTRIVSSDQVIEEEKSGRLEVYYDLIKSSNLLFGKGPGMISASIDVNGTEKKTAESYLMLILFENGLWFLLSFLVFYSVILFYGYRKQKAFFYLVGSIFISMIFVHVHTEPVFFVFWGVIIYGYINITRERISPLIMPLKTF